MFPFYVRGVGLIAAFGETSACKKPSEMEETKQWIRMPLTPICRRLRGEYDLDSCLSMQINFLGIWFILGLRQLVFLKFV